MELNEVIKRLNELYHKSQQTALASAELEERNRLRRIYLNAIRGQFQATLDRVKIVDEPGENILPGQKHTCGDHCSCRHPH